MLRYSISQFDGSTYQVIDNVEEREICVCSDYDEWEDGKERAILITALLNKREDEIRAKYPNYY